MKNLSRSQMEQAFHRHPDQPDVYAERSTLAAGSSHSSAVRDSAGWLSWALLELRRTLPYTDCSVAVSSGQPKRVRP